MARYPRSDRIHNDYHNYAPRSERSTEGLVYQIAAITRESMREGLRLGARNTSPYPPRGQRPRGTFFDNRGRGRFRRMPCAVEKLVKTKLSELRFHGKARITKRFSAIIVQNATAWSQKLHLEALNKRLLQALSILKNS
ncbi:hypothetical protein M422DRAFT_66278, partial [Sphaerobolus stellatus SS14]